MNQHLLYEDILFAAIATAFFGLVGWAWRSGQPYSLPHPLPDWFKVWFLTIQIGGIGLPLVALIWSVGRDLALTAILVSYLAMLGLQIVSESVLLRQFRSVVFVMVPYLYIPYRIWQLYEGMLLPHYESQREWIQFGLIAEIILWILNYALDLAQLPRLLHWPQQSNLKIEEKLAQGEIDA